MNLILQTRHSLEELSLETMMFYGTNISDFPSFEIKTLKLIISSGALYLQY
jgi:hypothetical protein